ncbi:MAG: hypothetical protein INR66_25790, partial [Gordonia polyisoprenivorans]|nr:hypothetical protein [Gordonia polyisoprenivorans]
MTAQVTTKTGLRRERELKFDVGEVLRLADLEGVLPIARGAKVHDERWSSNYCDTS